MAATMAENFCLTFASRMTLNLPGMVLPKQIIRANEHNNINEVTKYNFENQFSVTYVV
jgi:hypothetical protein